MSHEIRVLVTGAGGPAGVSVIRALARDPRYALMAADMDPYAAGLYLVDGPDRMLLPAGAAPGFADHLLTECRRHRVDVVVPTVDDELLPIAVRRDDFMAAGVRLALTGEQALRDCLDKLALAHRCAPHVRTPRTELWTSDVDTGDWEFPLIVKPRTGSGSRGIRLVERADQLGPPPAGTAWLLQEHLPGAEYSLDVVADRDSRVVAVVPRVRARVDSGVSVGGQTIHDDALDAFGRAVVAALGLTLVANVQCRVDRLGRPALLEVNPRFPGGLPLTVASGVDAPRLCLDAVLGVELPESLSHVDLTMVRFLDERFIHQDDLDLLTKGRDR